jgi:two-component system chemotaxis sensor kinase CheA
MWLVLAALALVMGACEDDSAYKSGKPLATKPTDAGAADGMAGDAIGDTPASGGAGGMVAAGGAGGAVGQGGAGGATGAGGSTGSGGSTDAGQDS